MKERPYGKQFVPVLILGILLILLEAALISVTVLGAIARPRDMVLLITPFIYGLAFLSIVLLIICLVKTRKILPIIAFVAVLITSVVTMALSGMLVDYWGGGFLNKGLLMGLSLPGIFLDFALIIAFYYDKIAALAQDGAGNTEAKQMSEQASEDGQKAFAQPAEKADEEPEVEPVPEPIEEEPVAGPEPVIEEAEPEPISAEDLLEKRLVLAGKLKEEGLINEEDFRRIKAKILEGL